MLKSVADIGPELVLLIGGVLVLLYALAMPRRWQAGAAGVALFAVIVAVILAAGDLGQAGALTFSGTYAVDGVAIWAKLIILGVTAVTISLSPEWFRTDARHGEFYTLLLFSSLGAVLMAGAADLMELILAALLSSATGFVLAAYHRTSKPAAEAAIKYYLLGALTNGIFLFGVVLFYGLATSTTYTDIRDQLVTADPGWALAVAVSMVTVGLAFKMAAVPAHQWMPDVAEGAPAPVAAFLTVAAKLGALVALARLAWILPDTGAGWRPLVAVIAAATMTLGNLAALRQDDVRRLLGWSSVSQTGYGLMAVVALGRSELALPSLLFFLLAYSVANLAAFGVVVLLRGRTDLNAYRGLARTHPLLTAALVVSFLSLIGIPPLAGFTAKLALFGAAIEAGYAWLAILAIVNTVVSVAYYARVIAPAVLADSETTDSSILGPLSAAGTGVCALLVVVIGIAAEPFFAWFSDALLLP